MKRSRWTSLAVVVSLLGGAQAAWAQDKPKEPTSPKPSDSAKQPADATAGLFKQLDKNRDGVISPDEIPDDKRPLFERMLRTADKDGNGTLSAAEFAAGLTASSPPSAARPDAPYQPAELFRRLDRNGDGKLQPDEIPEPRRERFRESMKLFDTNGDGAIDKEEFAKLQQQLFGQFAGAPGKPNGQPGKPDQPGKPEGRPEAAPGRPLPPEGRMFREPFLFHALDTDGDHKLSASEIEHAAESLKKLDKNGDGILELNEVIGRPGPGEGPGGLQAILERWKAADKNGDGKLSEEEAPEGLKRNFKRIDTNGDGLLDEQELRQMFSRMRDREQNGAANKEEPAKGASEAKPSTSDKPGAASDKSTKPEKPASTEKKP